MSPLWTRNRIFRPSLSGSFWILLCMALLIVFSQPLSALQPGFQTASCWSCNPALYRLRLEWIWQLTEEAVPKFIFWSRDYPVILFTYAVFNYSFRSCCCCFCWASLRKSFKLYNPIDFMLYISLHDVDRFHVDFNFHVLSILLLYASSSPVHSPVNKLSLAFHTLVLLDYSLFVSSFLCYNCWGPDILLDTYPKFAAVITVE